MQCLKIINEMMKCDDNLLYICFVFNHLIRMCVSIYHTVHIHNIYIYIVYYSHLLFVDQQRLTASGVHQPQAANPVCQEPMVHLTNPLKLLQEAIVLGPVVK